MKISKHLFLAIIATLLAVAPASAQFRWGIRGGVNITSLHLSDDASSILKDFNSENRTGFTGGLIFEFTVPVVGIGMDASVLYTHSTFKNNDDTFSNDYIDVPVNLKYKLGLPVVSKFVLPYFFTGPDFAFLVSKKRIQDAFENKSVDVSWNLGAGLELVSHLQLSAYYSWNINKAVKLIDVTSGGTAKTNGWVVTAAYLF